MLLLLLLLLLGLRLLRLLLLLLIRLRHVGIGLTGLAAQLLQNSLQWLLALALLVLVILSGGVLAS